jgi:hypothetical protein
MPCHGTCGHLSAPLLTIRKVVVGRIWSDARMLFMLPFTNIAKFPDLRLGWIVQRQIGSLGRACGYGAYHLDF